MQPAPRGKSRLRPVWTLLSGCHGGREAITTKRARTTFGLDTAEILFIRRRHSPSATIKVSCAYLNHDMPPFGMETGSIFSFLFSFFFGFLSLTDKTLFNTYACVAHTAFTSTSASTSIDSWRYRRHVFSSNITSLLFHRQDNLTASPYIPFPFGSENPSPLPYTAVRRKRVSGNIWYRSWYRQHIPNVLKMQNTVTGNPNSPVPNVCKTNIHDLTQNPVFTPTKFIIQQQQLSSTSQTPSTFSSDAPLENQ